MQERYHIDVDEEGLMERRSARWLKLRIRGLLSVESRLYRQMFPPEET